MWFHGCPIVLLPIVSYESIKSVFLVSFYFRGLPEKNYSVKRVTHFSEAHLWPCKNISWSFFAKMVITFYLLTILPKNTFYMFGRILNTLLHIVMIASVVKGFYTTSSQHTLEGLNLVFGIILIFFLVHFTLI